MYKELFDEESYKLEAKKHNEFLNSVLGVIAFTLALSCMGFEHPQRPAILCLGILIPIYWRAWASFPPTLYELIMLAKETKDQEVIEAIKYLEKKYHGWKAFMLDCWVLWSGLALYICVLLRPEWLAWFIERDIASLCPSCRSL